MSNNNILIFLDGLGSNQMGIFCWHSLEINVLFFQTKFNEADSHVCDVNTKEGGVRTR